MADMTCEDNRIVDSLWSLPLNDMISHDDMVEKTKRDRSNKREESEKNIILRRRKILFYDAQATANEKILLPKK